MSTDLKPSSDTLSAVQQRRQATILLLRLQWLFILLLIIALAWLYVAQQRFQNQMNERLQSNEQVVSRMNEIDDRLFAISQQSLPVLNTVVSSQAQNQLDLLRIQIQAADRLLTDNNYSAAIDLLRGLQWQLSQSTNEIAPALTVVIKQSLAEDIERLQAQSTQPSPWQLQNLAIQDIQEFLHDTEGKNSAEGKNSVDGRRVGQSSSGQQKAASKTLTENSTRVAVTNRQLIIHEVIMTLNLAMQASNMREKEQLTNYLQQARKQLQALAPNMTLPKNDANAKLAMPSTDKQTTGSQNSLNKDAPRNIAEVIVWLDKLIANEPISTPLLTTQVLEQPKS